MLTLAVTLELCSIRSRMSGRSEPAAVLGDGSVAGRGGTVTSLQDHVVGVFSARDLELGQRPFLLETMKLRCCMGFGCLLGTWLTSPMGWTSHSPPAEKGLGLTIKSEDPHLSRTRSRLFTVQILQPKISNTSEDAEVRETSRFWYVLVAGVTDLGIRVWSLKSITNNMNHTVNSTTQRPA